MNRTLSIPCSAVVVVVTARVVAVAVIVHFSTTFLTLNVPIGPHKDPHNHAAVENTLIPLALFSGGEVFEEDNEGTHQLERSGLNGNIKSITMPFTSLRARRWHLLLPWMGDRFVLGSFHIRDMWRLQVDAEQHLKDMGMQLLH